jgi:hypothetical protein
MLFKLRVRSDLSENFVMFIDADANNDFYQLHKVIQEECKNDPSQPASFFLADEEWDKGQEIRMFSTNRYQPSTSTELLMKNTKLGEIIKNVEDKLIYVFDLYNQKSFYIELNEVQMKKAMSAPVITLSKGIVPVQTTDESNDVSLIDKEDPELQNVFDDLGEIEDLNEIYGEMSIVL